MTRSRQIVMRCVNNVKCAYLISWWRHRPTVGTWGCRYQGLAITCGQRLPAGRDRLFVSRRVLGEHPLRGELHECPLAGSCTH